MSRKTLDRTLHCIRKINRARTAEEICSAVLHAASEYGFQHLLAGTIPLPGATRMQQEANVLLHHWPTQWWERYFSRGYLFTDPAIKQVLCGVDPFLWSDLAPLCREDAAALRVMNEARDFGLRTGLTVSLATLDGDIAGFSLAGEHTELPPPARSQLHLLATYATCRALLIDDAPRSPLSARERDVLQWAAEGKSEWEIAVILGISEHTADKALRLVRSKLRAVSTTHAVAIAIRIGLID